jgi:hypothetical protein
MLEKIVYTIREQSAIFQLTRWRSRVYPVLLVEKSGTFITYSVIYYFLIQLRKATIVICHFSCQACFI